MRVALAGKGGAGKTTVSAALARTWAADGRRVCAIDADSNPNLGTALGVPREAMAGLGAIPSALVSRRLDGGPALREPVEALLDAYAAAGPDGLRLLMMGMPAHADEGCLCSAHATIAAVMADLGDDPATMTVIDMEASPEHFSRGTARHTDVLLLVTEPYWRSLETTRRMALLAAELPIARVAVVGSKVRHADDQALVEEFCDSHGLHLLGVVPRSESVVDADVAGRSLVDVAGADDPVVTAVQRLALVLQPSLT
ncbi:carbon monoxide dehydrogenase accessory protein CooC [soil metagenome]